MNSYDKTHTSTIISSEGYIFGLEYVRFGRVVNSISVERSVFKRLASNYLNLGSSTISSVKYSVLSRKSISIVDGIDIYLGATVGGNLRGNEFNKIISNTQCNVFSNNPNMYYMVFPELSPLFVLKTKHFLKSTNSFFSLLYSLSLPVVSYVYVSGNNYESIKGIVSLDNRFVLKSHLQLYFTKDKYKSSLGYRWDFEHIKFPNGPSILGVHNLTLGIVL